MSFVLIIGLVAIVAINMFGDEKKQGEKVTKAVAHEQEDVTYVAPDFELTTLEGETVSLSDYVGKKVFLNFWATWCPPCQEEVPHMQAFYEEYQDQDVEIVAVNVTNKESGAGVVKQFIENHGATFNVLLDPAAIASSTYQVITLPTTYLIDSKGNMVDAIEGPMDEALMKELLNKLD